MLGVLELLQPPLHFFLFLVQGGVGQEIKQKTPVFSGLLQDANDRQLTIIPPCVGGVLLLLGVIAIIAPGMNSFHEESTLLPGLQFDHMGTSNHPCCNPTRSEASFACSDLMLCFSQHYLSPTLCPPYFAAVLPLSPRFSEDQSQQSLVLRETVFSAVIVCQFAASLALLCRDAVVCFPRSLKQKAVAVAADAADGDSALALLRPP